jgi:hypothetical protein
MEGRPPDDIAVMALHIRGDARCAIGDAGGLEDLEAALRLAETEGNMADIVTSRDYLAEWVWMFESPTAALPHIEASLAIAEARGQVSQGQWTRAGGLAILFDLGRWDDALAWGDDLLAGGRERVDDSVYAVVRTVRSRILSLRGVREAEGGSDELVALAASVPELQAMAPALVTAAELALADGRPDLAAECLRRFAEATADVAAQYREGELARVARACARIEEVALAKRLVSESAGLTRRDALNLASARATLAEAGGDPSAADLHLRAAEGWGAFGCPFEEAMALLGAARCGSAEGEGHGERARELLADLGVTAPMP